MSYIRKLYLESIKNNHHPLEIESCYFVLSLISIHKFNTMLEIGTGNGFSSTFFALKSDLKIIKTLEKNEAYFKNIKKLDNKIEYILTDAFTYDENNKYDIILIDGPKSNQEKLFEKYQNCLLPNGMIIIDNIFLKRLQNKKTTNALKIINKNYSFIKYLKAKKEWEIKIVNVGDGLAICKRKEKRMKVSVTCGNYSLAKKLIELGVDNIIVGVDGFSCRFNGYFSIDEIKMLCHIKSNTEITICFNDIYFEDQINELTQVLKELNNVNIDYIMFHDFAIPQICYEENFNFKFHYNPETIVTSYGQFDFYLKNKISRVSLASELMTNEMKKIGTNKKEMQVYIKGFGLGFVMHSRWPMLSNFLKYAKIDKCVFNNLHYWEIKEDLRKYPNIIFEDKSGTHMMTGYFLSCIKRMKELNDSKIDGLIIDSLFIKDDSVIQILNLFKDALNNLENQNTIENLFEKQKNFVNHIVSEGFFGKIGDILHTLKNDDEQDGK